MEEDSTFAAEEGNKIVGDSVEGFAGIVGIDLEEFEADKRVNLEIDCNCIGVGGKLGFEEIDFGNFGKEFDIGWIEFVAENIDLVDFGILMAFDCLIKLNSLLLLAFLYSIFSYEFHLY